MCFYEFFKLWSASEIQLMVAIKVSVGAMRLIVQWRQSVKMLLSGCLWIRISFIKR